MLKIYWWLLLILVEVLFLVLFVPNTWIQNIDSVETQMLESVFSTESMDSVHNQSVSWYDAAIVNTGVRSAMVGYVMPSGPSVLKHQAFNDYMENRVSVMLTLFYMVIRRIVVAIAWLPFLTLIAAPACIDGYLTWRIKRYGFSYPSPAIHRYAWRLKGVLILGIVLVLFVPLPVPPQVLPCAMAIFSISLGTALSYMPKRF